MRRSSAAALALTILLLEASLAAAQGPWAEGSASISVGTHRLTGGDPKERATEFGFLGHFRLSGWPVGPDLGLNIVLNQDFTRRPDGVYVPPITGTNLNELHFGLGRYITL